MAKVTIAVLLGSGADDQATSGTFAVRRVQEGVDGNMLVLSDWKNYTLSSEPVNIEVTVGELYESIEKEPRGRNRYWVAPAVTTNYGDLEDAVVIPADVAVLGDDIVNNVVSNPDSVTYSTLEQFVIEHPGPEGDKGDTGAPGGSDASFASWVSTPSTLTADAVAVSVETVGGELFSQIIPKPTGGDDAELLREAFSISGMKNFPGGVYLVGSNVDIALPMIVNSEAPTIIRWLPGAAGGVGVQAPIRITSSGVTLSGDITIDCARSTMNKTAFNAAGGEAGGRYQYGIQAQAPVGQSLSNLNIDVRIINSIDHGLVVERVERSIIKTRISASGGGAAFYDSHNLDLDIVLDQIDNDGWKVFQHAFDTISCTNFRGSVHSSKHRCMGIAETGGGRSNWFSGATMLDCSGFNFHHFHFEASTDVGQASGVGVSFLGLQHSRFSNFAVIGYSDVLMELGGIRDVAFESFHLDGRYARSGIGSTPSIGRGVALYDNATRADFSSRTFQYAEDVRFSSGTIRRCEGHEVDLWATRNTSWDRVHFTAGQVGVYAKRNPVVGTDGVAEANVRSIRGHRFSMCTFDYMERSGVEAYDLNDSSFSLCEFTNNGQATSYGAVRNSANGNGVDTGAAGFAAKTGSAKTGLRLTSPKADDTQNFTSKLSANPTALSVLSVDDDSRFHEGQTIKLLGAGASGVDVQRRINEVTHDEVTLDAPIVSVPLVAGTGTIATTGTTITGTGTAFMTQFTSRCWIKVGSQVRRISKVASDTSATLDSTFTANVTAGTSFEKYEISTQGRPSQAFGLAFAADALSPQIIGGDTASGNTGAYISDSTSAATPLQRIGMQGQVTKFTNTVRVGGNLITQEAGANPSTIGTVGPATEPALQLGGDATLYRESATALKTAAKMTVAGTGRAYTRYTTSGTLNRNLDTIDCDANGGAITLTLPTAAAGVGQVYTFRKYDASANTATIAPTSSQTINAAATFVLATQYQVVRIQSDGTNWIVI